ncbi:MAG: tetratricopeptide repeat protein [Proteobacteria bacterium]|nr:tetratricopeptide repeat protein [Pseudomonadota bacterium]
MAEEIKAEGGKRTPIIDPTPGRKKRLTELLYAFLNDRISLAELKGISRTELFQLSEAGYTKFKHGRLDEADKIFRALILLDHRNAYFHAMMGAVHQKLRRPIEAIMEYSQAVKIDPKDVASYVNRGELYLRHKNFRKAAEDFRQAILMDMSGVNMWANRARSLVIAIKRSMEAEAARRPRMGAPRR